MANGESAETTPSVFETLEVSGTMENAYGKKLPTPIKYSGKYESYIIVRGKGDEALKASIAAALAVAKAKEQLPNDEELVEAINVRLKNAARQKFMQSHLDAAKVEKPDPTKDPQLRLKSIFKTIMQGRPESERNNPAHIAEARDVAARVVGVAWADGN